MVMSTVPANPGGEVTVQEEVDEQLTAVPAADPKAAEVTVVPVMKLVPLTMTTVPPAGGPLAGAAPEMAGVAS